MPTNFCGYSLYVYISECNVCGTHTIKRSIQGVSCSVLYDATHSPFIHPNVQQCPAQAYSFLQNLGFGDIDSPVPFTQNQMKHLRVHTQHTITQAYNLKCDDGCQCPVYQRQDLSDTIATVGCVALPSPTPKLSEYAEFNSGVSKIFHLRARYGTK